MGLNWRTRLQEALSRQTDASASGAGQVAAGEHGRHEQSKLIPVVQIKANPHQPRQTIDDEALRDLADSIEQHGVLQPIIVRQTSSGYQLVAGQRRLCAAVMAGLSFIPAIVTGASEEEAGVIALVENLQREGLCFLEEAAACERLIREYGFTQEGLARRLGKSQSTVANKLRILRLPEEVRSRLSSPAFSERHARSLLSLRDTRTQMRVLDEIEAKGLTVRQTEVLIERLAAEEAAGGAANKSKPAQSWRVAFRDARILSNTFRSAVERLEQLGMRADLEETERAEGLEIRVLVHLPPGWRDGSGGSTMRGRARGKK